MVILMAAHRGESPKVPTSSGVSEHEFYLSTGKARYNEKTKELEIEIRLFSDDLENCLEKNFGVVAFLGDKREHPKADSLISVYLFDNFKIAQTSQKPRWVGKEFAPDVTWVYFTVPLAGIPQKLNISHTVFLDMFDSQVNILHMEVAGKKKSGYFNKRNREVEVRF